MSKPENLLQTSGFCIRFEVESSRWGKASHSWTTNIGNRREILRAEMKHQTRDVYVSSGNSCADSCEEVPFTPRRDTATAFP